jgi:hypothetical protein
MSSNRKIEYKESKLNLYNEHYDLFCNNMNPSLKKALGIKDKNNTIKDLNLDWVAPTTYGLNNSTPIIPSHYLDKKNPLKEIDMSHELVKDIRNLKPLDEIQLKYISSLSKEKVIELLRIYNEVLYSVDDLLQNL